MSSIIVEINGIDFTGWRSANISRSIESLSSSFSLSLVDRAGITTGEVQPGDSARIFLLDSKGGRHEILNGWIDSRSRSRSGESTSMEVSGRDLLSDIVDCAAVHPGQSWSSATLSRICGDLCTPFGISVIDQARDQEKLLKVRIQNGENVFSLIERLCRQRGVLPVSDRSGNLVLTYAREGSATSVQRLVDGENIISLSEDWDNTGRFSDYTVKGYTGGDGAQWSSESIALSASFVDDTITRYRPCVIMAEGKVTGSLVRRRAAWEAQTRAGKAVVYMARVRDWFMSPVDKVKKVEPWEPNTIVDFDGFGINTKLLVTSVRFSVDERSGKFTDLELKAPETYRRNPEVK